MGLFDLLRGLVPGAAQQLARNSWMAVANQPPSWLVDPSAYDWSDVLAPSPLPDRVGAPNLPGPVPLPDGPHPSFDDIHAQLLAGAASQIRPGDFAINPDNWPPLLSDLRAPRPVLARSFVSSGSDSELGLRGTPQSIPSVVFPLPATDLDRSIDDSQPNSNIQLASADGDKKEEDDPVYKFKREFQQETPAQDFEHGRGPQILGPLPLPGPQLRALPAPKLADHHLFPRQFAPFFESRGISIDDHTITVGQTTHQKGVHGKGLGEMPGGWNQRWSEFIADNPNATAADIFQQAGKMMDEYGLNDLPVHPYGDPSP